MFARLGPWCHDRRKLVLGLWIAVLVLGGVVVRRGRQRVPRRVQPARRRVQDRASTSSTTSSAARAPAQIGTIVFQAEQGVDDPEVRGGDAGAVRRGRRASTTSTAVESPYAEEGDAPDRRRGRRGRQDRLRQRRDARRHRLHPGRRDPRRDPRRRRPRSTGCEIELGGFIFAEFEEPSSEVLGLAFAIVILILAFGSVLAMGLPVGVALFGIGIGTAIITLLSNVLHDPRLRHVPRHHDRPRRRHRLRAADRHPLPRAAPRRAHRARVDRRSPSTPPAGRCCSPAPPS